jgi:hypothetical protein
MELLDGSGPTLGVGLDDGAWIKREDAEMQDALQGPDIDHRQVSFIL